MNISTAYTLCIRKKKGKKKKSLKNWVDVKENKRYKELYIGGEKLAHPSRRVQGGAVLTPDSNQCLCIYDWAARFVLVNRFF